MKITTNGYTYTSLAKNIVNKALEKQPNPIKTSGASATQMAQEVSSYARRPVTTNNESEKFQIDLSKAQTSNNGIESLQGSFQQLQKLSQETDGLTGVKRIDAEMQIEDLKQKIQSTVEDTTFNGEKTLADFSPENTGLIKLNIDTAGKFTESLNSVLQKLSEAKESNNTIIDESVEVLKEKISEAKSSSDNLLKNVLSELKGNSSVENIFNFNNSLSDATQRLSGLMAGNT